MGSRRLHQRPNQGSEGCNISLAKITQNQMFSPFYFHILRSFTNSNLWKDLLFWPNDHIKNIFQAKLEAPLTKWNSSNIDRDSTSNNCLCWNSRKKQLNHQSAVRFYFSNRKIPFNTNLIESNVKVKFLVRLKFSIYVSLQ